MDTSIQLGNEYYMRNGYILYKRLLKDNQGKDINSLKNISLLV